MRLLLLLIVLIAVPWGRAQEPGVAAKKLTVLVKPAKPFVFDRNGGPAGFSVDLWKRVAEEAGLHFAFKEVATIPELIDVLKAGQADVGFGAVSITAEREAVVDFSHPFYKSGLQILVQGATGRSAFRAFLKLDVLKILGLLLVAIAINAHILWFCERGRNPDSFPQEYPAGILNAAWWSVSVLITLGCENIAPTRVAGRLLGVVWMLAGVALYSYVTATLTSTMTVNTLQSDIRSVSDLQGQQVGTVTGSSSVEFLKSHEIPPVLFADIDSACQALAAGQLKAVVYDAPLVRYYVGAHPNAKFQLVGDLVEKQDYGFALPGNSPLRKEINRALLKLGEEGYLDELEQKWFPPVSS
jgi:ABC-type amino acid transport substrate-binding protein